MDKDNKIPENIENYILKKEILLLEYSKKESQKARNQTVIILTIVGIIISFLAFFKINNIITTKVEEQTGSKFLISAKKILI